MSTTTSAPPLTYDDYVLIPDDGKRHEIIDGDEYTAAAPTTSHQRVVGGLLNLYSHVTDHERGEVFIAPCDVLLSDTDIVQPDVLFVAAERARIVKERGIEGAPDLIAEVISEGNRRHDEVRKRKLYARHGVAEYWVVDPALETVKVYRHPEDGYERVAECTAEGEDTLTTPLLSDWQLSLADLFA